MTHPRTLIRAALKSLLDDGSIVPSGRVYTDRSIGIEDDALPAINITQGDENSARFEHSGEQLRRHPQILVEGILKSSDWDDVDDDLDALAKKIEDKVKTDTRLNGTCEDIYLSRTQPTHEADAAYPVGRILLTFTVEYFD